jgi:arginyl-tRNA synthetase
MQPASLNGSYIFGTFAHILHCITMLTHIIKNAAGQGLKSLYPDTIIEIESIGINQTKPEFVGDYTVVLFPFVKLLRQKPDFLGDQLGEYLVANNTMFTAYQVISGFLNLTVSDSFFTDLLQKEFNNSNYGTSNLSHQKVMIEYSSPNTNKPLHFGHLRNNFLGFAVSNILKATGNNVIKANLVNDRGIHICKSMIAWQRYANGATPMSTGLKGDKFVGDYYVKFNDVYKQEVLDLMNSGMDKTHAEKEAPIMKDAQQLLRLWEAGNTATFDLWKTMNGWVYEGFDITYKRLGIDFDKMYYESETYLLGKAIVEKGLEKGILFKQEDNSVWIDLTAEGLDEKLLLRGDGTSVYMTQDLGTAVLKYNDYQLDRSVYVIADEQNYHMQVLKVILQKLGEPCADGIFHLSYGMVELPTGRMKSREGTVVDADDMVDEMITMAQEQTEQAGKTEGFTEEELNELYNTIGLGALKFYLLRVDPKKKMIFDPKESIDLHGFTATFIQYAHARICSILRKENMTIFPETKQFKELVITQKLSKAEKSIMVALEQYPTIIESAAIELNPANICNYAFQLSQLFNTFYDQHSIAKAENEEKKQLRLMMIVMIAQTLRHAMNLMGIRLPEKM